MVRWFSWFDGSHMVRWFSDAYQVVLSWLSYGSQMAGSQAMADLDDAVRSSDFATRALRSDWGQLKKSLPLHEFQTELVRFPDVLEAPVQALATVCQKIMRHYNAEHGQ